MVDKSPGVEIWRGGVDEGEGGGGVEIFRKSGEKVGFEGGGGEGLLVGAGDLIAPAETTMFGCGEIFEIEIAFGLVVSLKYPELEIHEGISAGGEIFEAIGVAERFGDFLIVDGDEIAVEPEAG